MISICVSNIIGISMSVIMERLARESFEKEIQISEQKSRADNLLFNTFPHSIASRLIQGEHKIADSYDNVSVLFADLEGYTKTSSNLPPEELVHQLNIIFSNFDELALKFGCEKIKTIGDAYMAVAGAPIPNKLHAEAALNLALAMKESEKRLNLNNQRIKIKIGIHSGPVVAGIIGQTRFAYDFWGDTVNTASRMESTSLPNSIQMSKATYELVKHIYPSAVKNSVEVKGKGLLETWSILYPA